MRIETAKGIISTQLEGIKKADRARFIEGRYEYELRAAGTWIAPYFRLYRRPYGNARLHFREVGIVNALEMMTKDQVLTRAREIARKG